MDADRQQIAVIYERTMYHMRLGTQPAIRGKEEYVVTFPADIPRDTLAEALLLTATALNAQAAASIDHELRDPDTWTYRIVPVRFPMEAYAGMDVGGADTAPVGSVEDAPPTKPERPVRRRHDIEPGDPKAYK